MPASSSARAYPARSRRSRRSAGSAFGRTHHVTSRARAANALVSAPDAPVDVRVVGLDRGLVDDGARDRADDPREPVLVAPLRRPGARELAQLDLERGLEEGGLLRERQLGERPSDRAPSDSGEATAGGCSRGVERVSQPVADEVHREHGDEDRDAGRDPVPGQVAQDEQLLRVVEHVAPGGRRRLHADAQVRERGLGRAARSPP